MAALREHVSVAPIFKESDVLSVTESYMTESIILSCGTRSVSVIKVTDQKPACSWSLKHGVQVTSPVVWDSTVEKMMAVFNSQDIKVWEKDCPDLEKVKRKHAAVKIHQVLTIAGHDAILLCKTGSVDFLSNYKELSNSGPINEDEDIIWCKAAEIESCLVVALVTVKQDSIELICHKYEDELWKTEMTSLTPPVNGATICSCDAIVDKDTVKLFILWSNGDLSRVDITAKSIPQVSKQQTFSGIHGNCSMVVIDMTHIAVAGVVKGDEEGIAIYDLKFGVLQSWQPYPYELEEKPKLFFVAGYLFLPCRTMLYMYRVDCQPSTLASLLGQTTLSTDQQHPPSRYKWMAGKMRDSSPQKSTELANLFKATLNKKLDYQDFKSAFQNLMSALRKQENSHWLMGSDMVQLIQRCISEKRFWPSMELKQLLDLKCVPPGLMSETLDVLIQHSEVMLVDTMMSTQSDIPEKCLCSALSFYLQYEDEKLSSVLGHLSLDEEMTADTGQDNIVSSSSPPNSIQEKIVCPLSPQKSFLINKVLASSYSDVFLLECLKDINFKHALKLLEYLCYLLGNNLSDNSKNTTSGTLKLAELPESQKKELETVRQQKGKEREEKRLQKERMKEEKEKEKLEKKKQKDEEKAEKEKQRQEEKVVDWLCLVLDSHMTQFVLSPDSHVTLINLHCVVSSQVEFYDGLANLECLLNQLKAQSELKQDKKIGQYCIEVLHIR